MTLYKWSQTASADATVDSTINWAEGQSPSSVNDSARAMMAAIAKYRDDVAGAIVTTGTSTAYAVNTYQVFQSLAQLNGQVIAFTPHTTNGATVTINVDGLGTRPLRSAPGIELPAGTIVQGTPYVAIYNASDSAFYAQGFFGNPYSIMIGGSVDFWGTSAPNSSFVLMYGQAISRTAYSTLFSMFSTMYGSGDGSTTFNIPDCRGRVTAGRDDMGGSAASRLSGATITTGGATTLGGSGGTETKTLITANLPPYTPVGTFTGNPIVGALDNLNLFTVQSPGGTSINGVISQANATPSGTFTGTAQGGTSTAFGITQPTIIANKLLRII